MVCNQNKTKEWSQYIGYVIFRVLKKTFETSTQYYILLNEVLPKKLEILKVLGLPNSIRGIKRNRKTFSADFVEHSNYGIRKWGLAFLGIKSRILVYYILGDNAPTVASNFDK